MSTEHHKHDDQRSQPDKTGEQVKDPGIQVVSGNEMEPARVIAEIPGDDAAVSGASSARDQRWHDVLANFVDDPRGSVLAATELVVNDVSAFVAVLDQRRKSMLNAPPEDYPANTEDLRQAASTYRDISNQLTASTQALRVSRHGKLARDDREAERREVIGGRFDAAGGRQVMPHRDAPPAQTPPAQTPPAEPSAQDHRDIAKWRSGRPSGR
jgi:hypothetical protein